MRTPDVSRPQTTVGQAITPYNPPTPAPVQPASAVRSLQPVRLDPYPERSELVTGVRQTTDPYCADLELLDESLLLEPLPSVSASVEPDHWWMRYGWFPLATTLLSALAQIILAVTIAANAVPPLVGLVGCLSILVCGLCLISAQCVTHAGGHR